MDADIWTTCNDQIVSISSMSDYHLLASYRMMERNGYIPVSIFNLFLYGPRPSGDMATLAWEQELDEVVSKRPHPLMDRLMDEIKRRNLIGDIE
jgi:hypothetical protein